MAAFVAAVLFALAGLGVAVYGGVRRGATPPPTSDFSGLVLTTAGGVELVVDEASVECELGETQSQGVLATLTAVAVEAETGAEATLTLTLGAAAYSREQNLSLPHLREDDDPRYMRLVVELPAQTFNSARGTAGGSVSVRAGCTAEPFVELIGDGQLGQVGGPDVLKITGSVRADS